MAVPKIVGIETEYGVALRGAPDPNPVVASSLLINGYVEQRRVGWDFEDESPGRDARGFARDGAQPPEIETHLVNAVLTNGARYYVDHAHPEYSTPECADPLEVTLFDKAGERILARSMEAARRLLPPGQEIVVYKNNSDGKGNSYGCHENYLVDRNVPFALLVRNLIPWFVTRQVFTGAGKVGSENGADAVDYQISQRADFFEEEVGLETTLKRPIVNTRDEPHADPQKYRRLHVIVGDANLCEVATFLKIGTTAIVLSMIEDGFIDKDLSISSPVAAMRTVSHDPTLPGDGRDRRRSGAAPRSSCSGSSCGSRASTRTRSVSSACGGDAIGAQVLDRWEQTLAALERDPIDARRTARLGDEVEAHPGLRRSRRPRVARPEAVAARPCSTTTCAPTVRCTSAWCATGRSNACSRARGAHRDGRSARNHPGVLPRAPASLAGPIRSSPPTGTAWCSTSGSIPCEESR